MVNYNEADVADEAVWKSWGRFEDVEPYQNRNSDKGCILPLLPRRGEEVWQMGAQLRQGNRTVNIERYKVVSEVSLYDDFPDYLQIGKNWFGRLGIDPEEEIYVSWNDIAKMVTVTRWKTFCDYWDDFWGTFDVVNVFDETLSWGVLLGPENWAIFIREGKGYATDISGAAHFGAGLVACQQGVGERIQSMDPVTKSRDYPE